MSFINPVIQTNKLLNQITELEYFTGFLSKFIGVNNPIISNNYTSATFINNTQYIYSSISRSANFSMEMILNLNSNLILGLTTDITKSYIPASAPSIKMIDLGMVCDSQSNTGFLDIFQVVNGVVGSVIQSFPMSIITAKITYDGVNLKYYVNNNIIYTLPISIVDNIYCVVSSFYNGSCYNLSFTGDNSSGGSGSSQDLKEVLLIGNDAGNNSINNVNNLSSNQVISTTSIQTPLLIGTSNNLNFSSDTTKTKGLSLQTITGAGPDSGNPYLFLSNQSTINPVTSRVFDTVFNSPQTNYYFDFNNIGSGSGTGKIYPNIPKSIMTFKLNKGYQSFTCNFTKMIFDIDNQGSTTNPIYLKLYLSNTINSASDDFTGAFTTDNLLVDSNFTNIENVILTYYNSNNLNPIIYLNAFITNDNGGYYDLNNLDFSGQIIANSLLQIYIAPSLIAT
jgi:hypothetical protein